METSKYYQKIEMVGEIESHRRQSTDDDDEIQNVCLLNTLLFLI